MIRLTVFRPALRGTLLLLAVTAVLPGCRDIITSAATGDDEYLVSIDGVVEADYGPLEGTEVGIALSRGDPDTTLVTDADGSYSLDFYRVHHPADDVTFEVEAEGFHPYEESVPFSDNFTHDIELEPGIVSGTARGQVMDAHSGDPVEGATLYAHDPHRDEVIFEASSDEVGDYRAEDIEFKWTEDITYEAEAAGYEDYEVTEAFDFDEVRDGPFYDFELVPES